MLGRIVFFVAAVIVFASRIPPALLPILVLLRGLLALLLHD